MESGKILSGNDIDGKVFNVLNMQSETYIYGSFWNEVNELISKKGLDESVTLYAWDLMLKNIEFPISEDLYAQAVNLLNEVKPQFDRFISLGDYQAALDLLHRADNGIFKGYNSCLLGAVDNINSLSIKQGWLQHKGLGPILHDLILQLNTSIEKHQFIKASNLIKRIVEVINLYIY